MSTSRQNLAPSQETNKLSKYGAVYTPDSLAQFVAKLCWKFAPKRTAHTILDPSSGELALLRAINEQRPRNTNANYIGIDIDEEAIQTSQGSSLAKFASLKLIHEDFLLPAHTQEHAGVHWAETLGPINLIISNPPWSSDRRYSTRTLLENGYSLPKGQYDAYSLFIEQSLRLLAPGGIAAFILPDSLFSNTNKELRRFLASKFKVRVIARLGEKIFSEVNRSTVVLVIENSVPSPNSVCTCFRLNTSSRHDFLNGNAVLYSEFEKSSHKVKQSRFLRSENYSFDVDTREDEEELLSKIERDKAETELTFSFGRGVEISKAGTVVKCTACGKYQGISASQRSKGEKTCAFCKATVSTEKTRQLLSNNVAAGNTPVFAGEDVKRYKLARGRHLEVGVFGIDYKNPTIYSGPKIVIRKTGLGINASLDDSNTFVTQTVYLLRPKNTVTDKTELWFYLALLNSRVVFYYYLKVFGENEWKSHPYLTKQILFQLPLRNISTVPSVIVQEVALLAERLQKAYTKDLDIQLEALIFGIYGLTDEEQETIRTELDRLPDLRAINEMKF